VTAGLGLLTWASYLLVYTPLKRITPLSLLVGAVPGALPPVMGWTAGGGALDARALALFALLFVWQIPHFLAIASLYGEQYRAAGIRVLGLEHGQGVVGRQMLTYTLALLPLTLWMPQVGLGGPRYRIAALVLGSLFALAAARQAWRPDRVRARQLLLASVFYLPLLLAAMIADKQA
jgi:heme o synthase